MAMPVRLITSVGIAPGWPDTKYRLGDAVVESTYSSVALVRLLKIRNGKATVLLTEKAAEVHRNALEQALADAGWHVEFSIVPEGGTEDDQMETASKVMDAVKPGEAILLDVTQGLRHLPFAYLAALTYLIGLQGNELKGIYYCAFELSRESPDGAAPIFELTSLFHLLEWFQDLGAAKETGDLRPVARGLQADRGRLFRRGMRPEEFGNAVQAINRLADALAIGAPIEVGLEVARAVRALEGLEPEEVPWLPAQRVVEWLKGELLQGRWGQAVSVPTDRGSRRRDAVALTPAELARQLEIAQWYADRNDFLKTLLLLREWLVSAAIWAYGDPERWLDQQERSRAERRLHALERQLQERLVTKDQALLGFLWQRLRGLRNSLAHAGMREEPIDLTGPARIAAKSLTACRDALGWITRGMPWPIARKGRLVITPLGSTPGPLYTLCRRLHPDRLLVVTSSESLERIDETLSAAGMADVERRVILLADPFADDEALSRALDRELRVWLASAGEVVANVTGGTSFMGYIVQRLADEAKDFGQSVKWCLLIDRRPRDVQRTDPYVEGEVRWLEAEEAVGEAAV